MSGNWFYQRQWINMIYGTINDETCAHFIYSRSGRRHYATLYGR